MSSTLRSRFKEAISPFEALPLWPSGSFVEGKAGLDGYFAFGVAGLVALAIGVAWTIRRREWALLVTLIGLLAVYLITLTGGYYVQAKALAVASPLIALVALRGLLGDWEPRVLRAIAATAFIRGRRLLL